MHDIEMKHGLIALLLILGGQPALAEPLDRPVLGIITTAVERWKPLLACTLDDPIRHAEIASAWREERSELASLFDDAQLSPDTRRSIAALTDPAMMIASFATITDRATRCEADTDWRELSYGTHQSDPSLEIIRLLGKR